MKLILLTFSLLVLTSATHDVAIALFKIHTSENNLRLDMSFDIEDICTAMKTTEARLTEQSVEQYINENTLFEFDGQRNSIKVKSMNRKEDHLKVKAIFKQKIKNVKHLIIINHCLIDIEDHSNIISVDLNNESRDFRMDNERLRIEISY